MVYGSLLHDHSVYNIPELPDLIECRERREQLYTVRKVLAYSICYCKALCNGKFRQIEGNGQTFRTM